MLKPVELSARSDVGRVRAHNEDRYLAAPPLLAVADGMGGAQAGEVAAGVAVEHLEALGPEPSPEELRAAIVEANEAIRRMAAEDPERAGMGTTVTAALLGDGGRLELMHVGDSRAYLLRGDRLERLTRDHSLVADMIERGSLTEEEAGSHPQRNVITRALGAEPGVEVEHSGVPLQPGDVVLLCTDGLCGHVPDEEIRRALTGSETLDDAAEALVEDANAAGGPDNVTVLLARFDASEGSTAKAPVIPAVPAAAPKPSRPPRVLQRVERRRSRRAPILIGIALFLAIGIGAAAWAGSRTYFVDARGGTVHVEHGFPVGVGPVHLYGSWADTGVQADAVRHADPQALDESLRGQGEAVERAVGLVWAYGLPPAPDVRVPVRVPGLPAQP
jgi:PPM family protein phosphatase